MFSVAIVTVKPGALREVHWHTTSDEWNFFIAGKARIGIYAAANAAQTFDYNAGDTGYIPKAMTHYVENVGKEDLIFIEVLAADHFSGECYPNCERLYDTDSETRHLTWTMAWFNATPNRSRYAQFDKYDDFGVQEREAVYRSRGCCRIVSHLLDTTENT